jgi:hypothetical protein
MGGTKSGGAKSDFGWHQILWVAPKLMGGTKIRDGWLVDGTQSKWTAPNRLSPLDQFVGGTN